MTFNDFQAYRRIMLPVLQLNKWRSNKKPLSFTGWIFVWLSCVLALCLIANCAHAAVIPEDKAIKCVIGEAENQGFIGMLALSHALRNRGTLKGCYGLNSPRVRHHLYSHRIYLMAQKVWEQSSIDYDMTRGATGWGNAQDLDKFAKCKWWRNCTITFMYRDHYFYRGVL